MDKLVRLQHVLLPADTPQWLHYAGRVLLGLLSLPLIAVMFLVVWPVLWLGRWLHGRGEVAVHAWRILNGP